jgi:hypothetical protein
MYDPNDTRDPQAWERMQCARRGWKAGASNGIRHREFTHPDPDRRPDLVAAYEWGFAKGIADRIAADNAACAEFGWEPRATDVLR